MEEIMINIPVVNTAVAQMISCGMLAYMGKRSVTGIRFGIKMFFSFLSMILFWKGMPCTNNFLWIVRMVGAFFLMCFFLYIHMDENKKDVCYLGLLAFSASEFVTALEQQLYIFYIWGKGMRTLQVRIFSLLIVYGIFFVLFFLFMSGCFSKDSQLGINGAELKILGIIVLVSFWLSNFSFLGISTPFTYIDEGALLTGRMLTAFCGLLTVYGVNQQRVIMKTRLEAMTMQELLRSQYLQYEQSKENIELLNYKYHDLKYQIQVLRVKTDPEKREEFLNAMEESVRLYEAQNKTGNQVADIILTNKSIVCEKEGIEMNCVVDGNALDFIKTTDLCSLLGNALDNAIECEKKIEDSQKKLIHVAVFSQNNFTILRFENYFEGELKIENGLPVTTKQNKEYHGFGLKSIRYIVEKYGGNVNIETANNWFILKILIPRK